MAIGDKEASAFVIELYGLLARADRPVSIVEIRDKLTPHFRTDAYEWWTAKRDAADEDTPDAYWTTRNKATAWAAWIDYKIDAVHSAKWFVRVEGEEPTTDVKSESKAALDSQHTSGKSRAKRVPDKDRFYIANPTKRPGIRVPVLSYKLEEWSPEAVEKQRAGMYGLQFDEAINGHNGALASMRKEQLVKLLELAVKARGSAAAHQEPAAGTG